MYIIKAHYVFHLYVKKSYQNEDENEKKKRKKGEEIRRKGDLKFF